ncbi:MAG: hypothetical protein ACKVW3_02150 [Phycisphaerales bacterium]
MAMGITRSRVKQAVILTLLLVLLAAVVNVAFAVTVMRSPRARRNIGTNVFGPAAAARGWPVRTPHRDAWPPPTQWCDERSFGYRYYQVHSSVPNAEPQRNGFALQSQVAGWPLPVIEQSEFWWDWEDPALKGPEPSQAIKLRWGGVILNPLLVGVSAAALIVLPSFLVLVARESMRRRAGECTKCGYQLAGFAKCPECGASVG